MPFNVYRVTFIPSTQVKISNTQCLIVLLLMKTLILSAQNRRNTPLLQLKGCYNHFMNQDLVFILLYSSVLFILKLLFWVQRFFYYSVLFIKKLPGVPPFLLFQCSFYSFLPKVDCVLFIRSFLLFDRGEYDIKKNHFLFLNGFH